VLLISFLETAIAGTLASRQAVSWFPSTPTARPAASLLIQDRQTAILSLAAIERDVERLSPEIVDWGRLPFARALPDERRLSILLPRSPTTTKHDRGPTRDRDGKCASARLARQPKQRNLNKQSLRQGPAFLLLTCPAVKTCAPLP
jgi:hypothetical protein